MKKKITVTTGSRAEYGLLRPVLREIKQSKKLNLFLIVTGMHLSKKYGLTINEIKKDGFKIYAKVNMLPRGDSSFFMSKALGEGIVQFSKIFKKLNPDLNLILGDRDEALASALAASHMNIINAHIHGGDKTMAGIDEYNRHAITKISNIHFAASKRSKNRIIRMGENSKNVFFTGSPGIDEIKDNKITTKKELEKKFQIKFTGEEILLVQHPVTTQIKSSKKQILNTLKAIVKIAKPTIAIVPNSDAGNLAIYQQLYSFSRNHNFIRVYPSLSRRDFLGVLKNCGVLVGNSSSGMIEGSYFQTPVVNIGIRQKDRERSTNVIDVKDDSKAIYSAILKAMNFKKKGTGNLHLSYGQGNASKKIVRILEKIKLNEKLTQKQITY